MQKISTCLWFDTQAEEAVRYYTKIFKNSSMGKISRYGKAIAEVAGMEPGSVLVVEFKLENQDMQALNGGPMFNFSPSLSYFISCEDEAEIDEKWKQLSGGGQVRMGLDRYPWAEKYGWTTDKFGVEWQLILAPSKKRIQPAFLFVDALFGKGEEAIKFYTSVFDDSKIESMSKDEKTNSIAHAQFTLAGESFVLMEGQGKHGHNFTHATSFVVNCDTQAEVDRYWNALSAGGSAEPCGWLMDKYGVSWQIVPRVLADLMTDPDSKKTERVMKAMVQMSKLDIEKLQQASAGI